MEKKNKPRTREQNASGHKYFTDVAEVLNDAGLDQEMVMTKTYYKLPNTSHSVKDLFRSEAHKMFGVTSTTELTTSQWSEVEQAFTRELEQELGVTLPEYPSEESLENARRGWKKL